MRYATNNVENLKVILEK